MTDGLIYSVSTLRSKAGSVQLLKAPAGGVRRISAVVSKFSCLYFTFCGSCEHQLLYSIRCCALIGCLDRRLVPECGPRTLEQPESEQFNVALATHHPASQFTREGTGLVKGEPVLKLFFSNLCLWSTIAVAKTETRSRGDKFFPFFLPVKHVSTAREGGGGGEEYTDRAR